MSTHFIHPSTITPIALEFGYHNRHPVNLTWLANHTPWWIAAELLEFHLRNTVYYRLTATATSGRQVTVYYVNTYEDAQRVLAATEQVARLPYSQPLAKLDRPGAPGTERFVNTGLTILEGQHCQPVYPTWLQRFAPWFESAELVINRRPYHYHDLTATATNTRRLEVPVTGYADAKRVLATLQPLTRLPYQNIS